MIIFSPDWKIYLDVARESGDYHTYAVAVILLVAKYRMKRCFIRITYVALVMSSNTKIETIAFKYFTKCHDFFFFFLR